MRGMEIAIECNSSMADRVFHSSFGKILNGSVVRLMVERERGLLARSNYWRLSYYDVDHDL